MRNYTAFIDGMVVGNTNGIVAFKQMPEELLAEIEGKNEGWAYGGNRIFLNLNFITDPEWVTIFEDTLNSAYGDIVVDAKKLNIETTALALILLETAYEYGHIDIKDDEMVEVPISILKGNSGFWILEGVFHQYTDGRSEPCREDETLLEMYYHISRYEESQPHKVELPEACLIAN